ncbi:MAG: fluoride efflux transporter CrcB [Bacteroidota bacterium]
MFKSLLIIGLGGFFGSISRYLVYIWMGKRFAGAFPYGTFLANILGCLFLGVLFGLAERENVLTPQWRLFLATGFCGSFTTFSTFAFENVALQQKGDYATMLIYTGLSVVLGFMAAYLGFALAKGA